MARAPFSVCIDGRARDLGGLRVRRLLPASGRRSMVGPFIFYDEMGPATLGPGDGIDVRPHPHIGLATLTYLFEGEILHRDSLGYTQRIRPGDVNWMVAGRGIVHSERTADDVRAVESTLHGIQCWVALPIDNEETAPSFEHHAAGDLPVLERAGVQLRLVAGEAFAMRAPVRTFSPMFYLDARLRAGASLELPGELGERALYSVDGPLSVNGEPLEPNVLGVLDDGVRATIEASDRVRIIVIGGAPLGSAREIWWNFVSSRAERIEQAKSDWRAGRFARVPGDEDLMPLPGD